MSGIVKLIPLILLFAFVGIFAWVAYQMYVYSQTLGTRARGHLEKRNISYSKDGGMKVGVKEMTNEQYSDKTQSVIVDAWNKSQWPDYKSRLWNKEAQKDTKTTGSTSSKRPSSSRHGSSTTGK